MSKSKKVIQINWLCDNDHPNNATIDLNEVVDGSVGISDVDAIVENLCSDPMFVNDNPCHICGDTTMQEIDGDIQDDKTYNDHQKNDD